MSESLLGLPDPRQDGARGQDRPGNAGERTWPGQRADGARSIAVEAGAATRAPVGCAAIPEFPIENVASGTAGNDLAPFPERCINFANFLAAIRRPFAAERRCHVGTGAQRDFEQ